MHSSPGLHISCDAKSLDELSLQYTTNTSPNEKKKLYSRLATLACFKFACYGLQCID